MPRQPKFKADFKSPNFSEPVPRFRNMMRKNPFDSTHTTWWDWRDFFKTIRQRK